jgi:hypothetical protein
MTDYVQLSTPEIRKEVEAIREALRPRNRAAAKRLRAEIDPEFRPEPERRTSVYVIELDESVRLDPSFADANPSCNEERPCLYVGMTSRTPEERFRLHVSGRQHSRIVKKFGLRLRPEFYERLNPMTYSEAEREEREVAKVLRREGYGVWQQ